MEQLLPLLQKEQGCQFAFSTATQVTVDRGMCMWDIVYNFEYASIKVGGICIAISI